MTCEPTEEQFKKFARCLAIHFKIVVPIVIGSMIGAWITGLWSVFFIILAPISISSFVLSIRRQRYRKFYKMDWPKFDE